MLGATPHTTTLAFQPVVAPNYQTGMSVTYSTYKVVFRHQGQRFALGFCGAGPASSASRSTASTRR
jgi:hypothetical protein